MPLLISIPHADVARSTNRPASVSEVDVRRCVIKMLSCSSCWLRVVPTGGSSAEPYPLLLGRHIRTAGATRKPTDIRICVTLGRTDVRPPKLEKESRPENGLPGGSEE